MTAPHEEETDIMRSFIRTTLGATLLLTAATAPAATVEITDCGAAPVTKVGKRP